MAAKTIMIQGTGSHVGKSVITAALCRMLKQDGFRVAPFKAQNMSNNSFVTPDGGEIGRAQAVQAEAAGIEPTIHMNPILLKPSSDVGAQVILHGKPFKIMRADEYQFHTASLLPQVVESLTRLMNEFDIVVIEGAGSPAEVNLQEYDIVNMRMAELAEAPVILVGDIDRGGVFASLVGTLELLSAEDRARIKAFLINKFRGDRTLLTPGLDFLLARTGVPTLGVIPYESRLGILEEDGLSDERIELNKTQTRAKKISVDVIWFPRISNFTDFSVFDQEHDVALTYLREIPNRYPDVLILPGTKSTIADLQFLRASGFDRWIETCVREGVTVIGICGGYQMLGQKILDPLKVEGALSEMRGLGLVPSMTTFGPEKVTKRVKVVHLESGIELDAYEIHMGMTTVAELAKPVFKIIERNGVPVNLIDGIVLSNSQVWGTYLHGIFDSDEFRTYFLNPFRKKIGISIASAPLPSRSREEGYDRLASLVRAHINRDLFDRILNKAVMTSETK